MTASRKLYVRQEAEVFCKKGLLKNFATFTRNDLCQSLFLIKMRAFRPKGMKLVYQIFSLFLQKLEKFLHVKWLKPFLSCQKEHVSIAIIVLNSLYYLFFHFFIFFIFIIIIINIFTGGKKRAITNIFLLRLSKFIDEATLIQTYSFFHILAKFCPCFKSIHCSKNNYVVQITI